MNQSNRKAFLYMIAVSEGTQNIGKNNGYDVIVTSTVKNPILVKDYKDHPRRSMMFNSKGDKSTAAGRYQILAKFWDAEVKNWGLKSFEPEYQDIWAINTIKQRGALDDIDAGRFVLAVQKCSNIWASLPGAGYGQHENKMDNLIATYKRAGGIVFV